MRRGWRDIRIIPVVLIATGSLFALKVSGLVFDGGYTLAERLARDKSALQITTESVPAQPKIVVASAAPEVATPAEEKKPWAREMFNFNADPADVTGSVHGSEGAAPSPPKGVSTEPPSPTKLEVGGAVAPLPEMKTASAGERAVLESLQERRRELEKRARDLDMRESLLKAAEKRLEAKLGELKSIEAKVDDAASARGKAEAQQLKSIVSMYENMKPKDAARIFDRLDLNILVEISTQMNARKMSEVLAQMAPEAAERLTVEIARRASAGGPATSDALPKIEGKPKS
jgi:flagellar motility protein MotE (MotC chaperone)